jgi:hypothetical protein
MKILCIYTLLTDFIIQDLKSDISERFDISARSN